MTFSIIPVKPFDQSKTRLASILSLAERISLSRYLLQLTIGVARQIGEVVIISRDTSVRDLAKQAGAWALVESGTGLNEAAQQASEWVTLQGALSSLILPGDLPLLNPASLAEMVKIGQQTSAIVIAPCRRLEGTNALLLRPPGLIEFSFGPDSFKKHQQAAQAIGVEPIIYRSPAIALDLDVPDDLQVVMTQPPAGLDTFLEKISDSPEKRLK